MKDDHVLACTGQSNMLGRLVEANQLLEEIQKGLNAYLEKKQLFFPRFVVLSYLLHDEDRYRLKLEHIS